LKHQPGGPLLLRCPGQIPTQSEEQGYQDNGPDPSSSSAGWKVVFRWPGRRRARQGTLGRRASDAPRDEIGPVRHQHGHEPEPLRGAQIPARLPQGSSHDRQQPSGQATGHECHQQDRYQGIDTQSRCEVQVGERQRRSGNSTRRAWDPDEGLECASRKGPGELACLWHQHQQHDRDRPPEQPQLSLAGLQGRGDPSSRKGSRGTAGRADSRLRQGRLHSATSALRPERRQ